MLETPFLYLRKPPNTCQLALKLPNCCDDHCLTVRHRRTILADRPIMATDLTAPSAPAAIVSAPALPPPSKSFADVRLARPAAVTRKIVWRYAIPLAAIHVFALAALVPWLFSWTGVVLLIAGTYFYGGLGINIAYHRLLTHRSFNCPLWLERFLVLVAVCCMEDAPGTWVATHRLHHVDSDEEPDPHSPLVSFLWSHVGWLLVENRAVRCVSAYERYARDVLRDPFYMRLQRTLAPVWIYLCTPWSITSWVWRPDGG